MRSSAVLPPGARRIQVPHFTPTDTDVCVCWGGPHYCWMRWKFWLFAKHALRVSWLRGLGVPPHDSPHGLHWHYKEGTSLLIGGRESPNFPTLAPLQ